MARNFPDETSLHTGSALIHLGSVVKRCRVAKSGQKCVTWAKKHKVAQNNISHDRLVFVS